MKNLKFISAVFFSITLIGSNALSQTLTDAKDFFVKGEYKKSYNAYLKLANENVPAAQSELGYLYSHGIGVDKNIKESFYWHLKAASNDFPYSQYVLGDMYSNGLGVDKNDALAYAWMSKAASNRVPEAMFNLSITYFNGIGVDIDVEKSYFWLLKSKKVNPYLNHDKLGGLIEKKLTQLQINKINQLVELNP